MKGARIKALRMNERENKKNEVRENKDRIERTSHRLAVLFFIVSMALACWIVYQNHIIGGQRDFIDRQRQTLAAISQFNNDPGGNIMGGRK